MDNRQCVRVSNIVTSTWLNVIAVPVPVDRSILLEVVFTTPECKVALIGKAHSIPDQEAFSLLVREHIFEGWWIAQPQRGIWEPRDIRAELIDHSLAAILDPPRQVRFFGDALLAQRVYAATERLDNCSAIEFLKKSGCSVSRFVVAASTAYPCCVELAMNDRDCDLLLMHRFEIKDQLSITNRDGERLP